MASAPPETTAAASVDVGRVLSRGFAAMRAEFLAFFAVSLLLAGLPGLAMQYWILRNIELASANTELTGTFWAMTLGPLLVSLLSATLLQGALTRSTVLQLNGRDADIGASALLTLRLLPALIALSLVQALMIGFGMILLIIPGVIIYCATMVAVPAMIEERRGIFESIGRSWDLTRGSRWAIFVLAILFAVFSFIVQTIVGLLSGGGLIEVGNAAYALRGGIAAGIGAAISTMIVAVLTAALYVELREVKEGATSEELVTVFA